MKFLITDAGNVLTRFKFRAQLVKEIMVAFGVADINPAEVFGASAHDASAESYYSGLDLGQFNVEEVWRRLTHCYDVDRSVCTYPLFLSLWCRHLEPVVEVVNLYHSLQDRYPIVVVSNGDSEGVRHLLYHLTGSYGLKFHKIFISAEHQIKKPMLWGLAADYVASQGGKREDCVAVDDIPAYVEAAKSLGMSGILFNILNKDDTADALKRRLAERGFVA